MHTMQENGYCGALMTYNIYMQRAGIGVNGSGNSYFCVEKHYIPHPIRSIILYLLPVTKYNLVRRHPHSI